VIQVRNNAAITTPVSVVSAGTTIPFDTVVIATNNANTLSNNAINILVSGVYATYCAVNLANSTASEVTVTLTAYADGSAITGSAITATIPANGYCEIVLPWTLHIITAPSGTANVYWVVSGATCTITNATAIVNKYL